MKKTTPKILLSAAVAFVLSLTSIKAQTSGTMIGTVTNPCANNGQITVTVTGLTPPINYTYNNWMVNQNITHSGVSTTTDNLTSISAYHSPWGNANIWQVTASDGTNTAIGSFTLTAPFTFVDSLHVGTCPAQSTLQASGFSGRSSPYSCVWTNQNTFISYNTNPAAVPNGPYVLVVTDNAGCMVSTSSTGSFAINVYTGSSMNLSVTGTAANCTNGTAFVNVSGGVSPYSYLWSNSATTASIGGLTAGNYTCLVTDNIGCQSVAYHYVQQGITINLNQVITNATCLQNNGSIMTFPTGGTAPYTFNWSNFATTSSISGVPGGTNYAVQVTDANSCTQTQFFYVGMTTPINNGHWRNYSLYHSMVHFSFYYYWRKHYQQTCGILFF
jgi:hypothetical protein